MTDLNSMSAGERAEYEAETHAGTDQERARVLALFDMDASSKLAPNLRAAIEGGLSPEAFAIDLVTASKARTDAPGGTLPQRLKAMGVDPAGRE